MIDVLVGERCVEAVTVEASTESCGCREAFVRVAIALCLCRTFLVVRRLSAGREAGDDRRPRYRA